MGRKPKTSTDEQHKATIDLLRERIFKALTRRGRTLAYLMDQFAATKDQITKILEKGWDGYDLFEPINDYNEVVYSLIRQPPVDIILQPRTMKYRYPTGNEYYCQIQIRDKVDEIRVVGIFDAHFGHKCHKLEKFRSYIQYIANTPGVYGILGGDDIENKSEDGRGHTYSQEIHPEEQKEMFVREVAPAAHKILLKVPGNHEDKTFAKTGIDVGRVIATRLNVPYFDAPVTFDLLWNKRIFTFFVEHGRGSGITKGGMINTAERPVKWVTADFYISGHKHNAAIMKEVRHIIDRENCRMYGKPYFIVKAQSFMGYWGTYAHKAGYEPPATGGSACVLYPDGRFRAEETAG